jgi:DNA-binding ferritin-like protein
VDGLAAALAIFARMICRAMETCDDMGDDVATDLLTGICRESEKQLWPFESHRSK